VSAALQASGLGVYSVLYSTVALSRDAGAPDLFVRVEVDRTSEPARLAQIEADLGAVLDEVRAAVTDWAAMRERVAQAAQTLSGESRAFVEWLIDDHFTLLGVARFEAAIGTATRAAAGSALGILQRPGRLEAIDALPIE